MKNEDEVIMDHLHSVAFHQCPLAYSILGPVENIKSITNTHLKDYVGKYYTGNRIIIAAAGGVDHQNIVDLAKEKLGHLPSGSKRKYIVPVYTGSLVEVRDDTKPFAHVAVAMKGPGNTSNKTHIVHILQALTGYYDRNIGAGHATSSELTMVVAGNKLAHRMSSFSTLYRDVGLFGVTGVTEPENLDNFVSQIFQSWNRLYRHLTPTELERAKLRVMTSLLIQMDGTTPICEDIGRQLQYSDQRLTLQEKFDLIKKVKVSDVQAFIEEYVHDQEPTFAAMGNLVDLPDYHLLRLGTQPLIH
jgi:processing peptidase subunit beta